jgi:hypothetical protein
VTEADWLAGTDPSPMLEYLRGKVSDRKLVLFAAACCRHIWHLLTDERCRAAVETAERFADGRADVKSLTAARTATLIAERETGVGVAARAPYWTAHPRPTETVWNVHTAAAEAEAHVAIQAVTRDWDTVWGDAISAAARDQADLLRDVIGNPFRPVTFNPRWVAWAGGTVRRIASHIYDAGRFEELPVLADALEDAGCDNADLLTHCRSGAEHARGCWAVDLLLRRN